MQNTLFTMALLGAVSLAYGHSSDADDPAPAPRADSHAPMGVMADHMHSHGEWMLSYRFMHMAMQGNRLNSQSISPEQIATTQTNAFAGRPGQPPTLRVVPLQMDMQMHMFGAMYAPSDSVTLMLMSHYLRKDMRHRTYQGASGSDVLGHFSTRSEGWGDSSITALWSLARQQGWRWHLQTGLNLPTGDTEEQGQVLAPNGMQPVLRLPYPMQLGSGSYDLLLGSTLSGGKGEWHWGAQFNTRLPLEDNDQGYRLGSRQDLSLWGSYAWQPALSSSLRLLLDSQSELHGADEQIVAPVQTADPDRQGGDRLQLGLGLNTAGQAQARGHRLGLEIMLPVWQRLNGPQLESDWSLTLAWQFSP